jgi:hypothetical protein
MRETTIGAGMQWTLGMPAARNTRRVNSQGVQISCGIVSMRPISVNGWCGPDVWRPVSSSNSQMTQAMFQTPFEQADPFGGFEDQVTRGVVEECARNGRGVDLGPRDVVELDVETAQRHLELAPCDPVRIMLPAGYERRPALLPDCRTEKDFYPLHQA